VLLTCVACLFAAAAAHAANDEHWLDIEGQIQYSYYTEDLRTLGNLAAQLDTKEPSEPLQDYYAALAYYRLALAASQDAQRAASAIDSCSAHLDQVLQARAEWAEALALQGACLGWLAELKALRAPFAGPRSRTQLGRALKIEPHNPRVLLLDAWLNFEHPRAAGGAGKAQACREFAAAVSAFEVARPGEERAPEWGPAEGYAYAGRCALERGDAVAARDALERALLIAPDFKAARRLLKQITAS
jgi:tetratricopeptide (TPR) repeat protein